MSITAGGPYKPYWSVLRMVYVQRCGCMEEHNDSIDEVDRWICCPVHAERLREILARPRTLLPGRALPVEEP